MKMSRCWCGVVLAILVIVFAWVDASWARIEKEDAEVKQGD
jgi:hypothetical protein